MHVLLLGPLDVVDQVCKLGLGAFGAVEEGGTTDAVAWVPLADILDGTAGVLDVVRAALAAS